MTLDPVRFPHTSRYLTSLPQGLDSFRECSARGAALEAFVRDFSRLAADPALPRPIADLISGRNAPTWLPEVVFQTTQLVIRDLGFPNDSAFHKWTYDVNQELFDKPFIRSLMRLMSPTLIVLGSAKRWGAFHRGSTLTPGPVQEESNGRVRTTASLTFPQGLFPPLFLQNLESAFLAALAGSRAVDARVELGAVSPTAAAYHVSFRG